MSAVYPHLSHHEVQVYRKRTNEPKWEIITKCFFFERHCCCVTSPPVFVKWISIWNLHFFEMTPSMQWNWQLWRESFYCKFSRENNLFSFSFEIVRSFSKAIIKTFVDIKFELKIVRLYSFFFYKNRFIESSVKNKNKLRSWIVGLILTQYLLLKSRRKNSISN